MKTKNLMDKTSEEKRNTWHKAVSSFLSELREKEEKLDPVKFKILEGVEIIEVPSKSEEFFAVEIITTSAGGINESLEVINVDLIVLVDTDLKYKLAVEDTVFYITYTRGAATKTVSVPFLNAETIAHDKDLPLSQGIHYQHLSTSLIPRGTYRSNYAYAANPYFTQIPDLSGAKYLRIGVGNSGCIINSTGRSPNPIVCAVNASDARKSPENGFVLTTKAIAVIKEIDIL